MLCDFFSFRNLIFLAVLSLLSACSSMRPSEDRPPLLEQKPHKSQEVSARATSTPIFTKLSYDNKINPPLPKAKRKIGFYKIGNAYKIKGQYYYPKEDKNYSAEGFASWYGSAFHNRLTANGEFYNMYGLSAAHKTLPLPSYARVTNLWTGASVIVRVNDRGPYVKNRIIDLSSRAADLLQMKQQGVTKVRVDYVGAAPLHEDDSLYLEKSFQKK